MPKVYLTQASRDAEKSKKTDEFFWKAYRVAKVANDATDATVAAIAGLNPNTISRRKHHTELTTVGELRAMVKLNLLTLEVVGTLLGLEGKMQ